MIRLRRLTSQLAPPPLSPSICTESSYGQDWEEYKERGVRRAMELGNRSPLRLGPDGRMDPEILKSYQTHGFYVFEDMVSKEEVLELVSVFDGVLENAPLEEKGACDRFGRLSKSAGYVKL